jgi:flagellar biosynthesis/type III secretory pathway protein FliH
LDKPIRTPWDNDIELLTHISKPTKKDRERFALWTDLATAYRRGHEARCGNCLSVLIDKQKAAEERLRRSAYQDGCKDGFQTGYETGFDAAAKGATKRVFP